MFLTASADRESPNILPRSHAGSSCYIFLHEILPVERLSGDRRIVLATAQSVVVSPYAAAPPKESTVLATTFVDWDSLVPTTTAVGQVRHVFEQPHHHHGQAGSSHHHPQSGHGISLPSTAIHWEEILIVKDGDFRRSPSTATSSTPAPSPVFLASNDPHNARNVGKTPGTYYVVNFVTDLSHSTSAKSAAEQAAPGKLASSVLDCNSIPVIPTPTGSRVTCANSPTLTFVALESHITTLNPGQHTAADILDPNDEIVIIKSGQVEVSVNGIASRMNAGSLMYWYPNDKRTLRNAGTTPTSYQVIRVTSAKSPKPIAN